MTLLFLDVETLPTSDPEAIAEIAATIKPPGTLKKQESIDAWMAENKESAVKEAVHKTGFSGLYGSICCICYAFDDGEVFSVRVGDEISEKVMLESFYSHVFNNNAIDTARGYVAGDLTVVGHNVIGFDLPFIKHRSIINKVKPSPQFIKAFNDKWGNDVKDTMIMWSPDKERRASMDKLCKAFGIPGKGDFDGSMVAETWPVDPEKVIEYCRDDVRRTREIYKRLTFQF
jgi:predicted PolB exonuclease-like 3'-5' exonuclease